MNDQIINLVGKFPSLTSTQFNRCQEDTREQIVKIIGNNPPKLEDFTQYVGHKPKSEDFFLEKGWFHDIKQIAIPTDWLMIPILVIMLVISLTHMLTFSGEIAMMSWSERADNFAGISFDLLLWVLIHQVGLFGMSELGVIIFYTANSMEFNKLSEEEQQTRSKFKTMNFVVAFMFALITIIANVSSLLHNVLDGFVLERDLPMAIVVTSIGVLIPVVTMFLGERFSHILLEVIDIRKKRTEEYQDERSRYMVRMEKARYKHQEEMEQWSGWHEDETTHPNYTAKLAQVIADYYKRYGKYYEDGEEYRLPKDEWTPELERSLAARELANMRRMEDIDSAINFFSHQEEGQ